MGDVLRRSTGQSLDRWPFKLSIRKPCTSMIESLSCRLSHRELQKREKWGKSLAYLFLAWLAHWKKLAADHSLNRSPQRIGTPPLVTKPLVRVAIPPLPRHIILASLPRVPVSSLAPSSHRAFSVTASPKPCRQHRLVSSPPSHHCCSSLKSLL